jgi:hypothetical protein
MSPLRPNDKLKPITAKYPWPSVKSLLRTMAALALGYVLLLAYLHYQGDTDIQRLFGGSAGLQTFNHADRVAAYRIDKPADRDKWAGAGLSDFPIINGPIAVSKSDVEILTTTLQERDSYIWNDPKGCEPLPGVRLDFIRGDDRLSILICFECDMIINYLNGKLVGGGDTEKVRPVLLRVAKSLFPDDATIQSLTPRH